jgi:hypothetical protein
MVSLLAAPLVTRAKPVNAVNDHAFRPPSSVE